MSFLCCCKTKPPKGMVQFYDTVVQSMQPVSTDPTKLVIVTNSIGVIILINDKAKESFVNIAPRSARSALSDYTDENFKDTLTRFHEPHAPRVTPFRQRRTHSALQRYVSQAVCPFMTETRASRMIPTTFHLIKSGKFAAFVFMPQVTIAPPPSLALRHFADISGNGSNIALAKLRETLETEPHSSATAALYKSALTLLLLHRQSLLSSHEKVAATSIPLYLLLDQFLEFANEMAKLHPQLDFIPPELPHIREDLQVHIPILLFHHALEAFLVKLLLDTERGSLKLIFSYSRGNLSIKFIVTRDTEREALFTKRADSPFLTDLQMQIEAFVTLCDLKSRLKMEYEVTKLPSSRIEHDIHFFCEPIEDAPSSGEGLFQMPPLNMHSSTQISPLMTRKTLVATDHSKTERNATPVSILIVEDEVTNLRLFRRIIGVVLPKQGFTNIRASMYRHGTDAIQMLDDSKETPPPDMSTGEGLANRVDVVFMDIKILGALDGVETAKAIKLLRPEMIIFPFSSNMGGGDVDRYQKAGMLVLDEVNTSKPFTAAMVRKVIEYVQTNLRSA